VDTRIARVHAWRRSELVAGPSIRGEWYERVTVHDVVPVVVSQPERCLREFCCLGCDEQIEAGLMEISLRHACSSLEGEEEPGTSWSA
jgi:hypothetical protein